MNTERTSCFAYPFHVFENCLISPRTENTEETTENTKKRKKIQKFKDKQYTTDSDDDDYNRMEWTMDRVMEWTKYK